ncbi:MAG: MarP family serine protease [Arthrobacter sp.]|uniref:MarP family serine protease n=1 Tax=unclassified Arthrobacter TaxID=235627 RepID=UPI002656288D|nr:MarP family serine protease [Micrococcaceae bacterium]MDN5813656.1 MarP family serine protease [Micrococcaceae bacterium]MDN5825293.1 MarP family serine protease [Micrococcaceae bacterium]MDN5880201.1 MarP family serine protease [Micrococcaceae bacterium]MDN5885400.1 MarP family serine protease [Micrococcaceae bacterium]
MIFGFSWLDILLLLSFVAFLISGLRKGLFVTLGGVVGLVAGGVGAFYAIPFVSSWVTTAGWRVFWVIATAVVLVLLGHSIGVAVGNRVRLLLNFPVIKTFDRLLGGITNVVVAALVISAIAFSAASMGLPFLSQQIASSQVISTIRNATPDPVSSAMAKARSVVMGQSIPDLIEPFAPAPDGAAAEAEPEAINTVEESVAKITGTAFACGVNQTGSGFVVAPDRILTNAHVVAGIAEPVVNTADGRALPARVVHFDSTQDLAVLAVDSLGLDPVKEGRDLSTGDSATYMGYPEGGPFQARGAIVQSLRSISVQNIYGADASTLEIYQLGADVQQGNSGGPLLDDAGKLVGVIFAKAKGDTEVGYALSLQEVGPVLEQASDYSETVSTGACSAH